MGSLITLAIYAAMAATALGAIYAFDQSRQNIGAKKQLAADAPVLATCVGDKKTAVDANVSLQVDLDRLTKERDEQSAKVQDLSAAGTKAQAEKRAAQAAAATALNALRSDKDAALARSKQVTKGETCETTLGKIDADLHDLAVRELRDRPNKADSGVGSPNSGTDPNSGANTLRLSK
jgi:hypothetical protein